MRCTPDELIAMGYKARRESRLSEARQIFSDAVALCRKAADQPLLAASLAGLGQIERDSKNNAKALQHYEEAVAICRRGADSLWNVHTIRHLADILREEGDIQKARPLYEEVLETYRRHHQTPALDLANAIRGFALLRGVAGENEEAKRLWQEARTLYESLNVQAGVQESDSEIARLAR